MRSLTAAPLLIGVVLILSGPLTVPVQAQETVGRKEMPNFCRTTAAGQFAVEPKKVKVKKLVEANDMLTVPGTVTLSENATTKFSCTFDMAGKFVQLVAEANEGE